MSLSVFTPHEILTRLAKPNLETINHYALAPDDILVVCGGFEDRAIGVLQNAVATQTPFQVLLIRYEPHLTANKVQEIHDTCARAKVAVQEAVYNLQSPAGFGDTLARILSECRGKIFLDVSGMSRLLIVQAIVALSARPSSFIDCFITYAQAKYYAPSQHDAETALARSEKDQTYGILFLSSGVFEVTVISELSSVAIAGEQTRLVSFPSLDEHHLIALRSELQPSRFSFIEGIPPNSDNYWRQKIIAKLNHLDQIRDAERYVASTLHYQDTLEHLLDIYSRHALLERLMIAPTGSKMQTVAVGIFRSIVHDVQIVYPTSRGFCDTANYTQGVGQFQILPLGAFSALEIAHDER